MDSSKIFAFLDTITVEMPGTLSLSTKDIHFKLSTYLNCMDKIHTIIRNEIEPLVLENTRVFKTLKVRKSILQKQKQFDAETETQLVNAEIAHAELESLKESCLYKVGVLDKAVVALKFSWSMMLEEMKIGVNDYTSPDPSESKSVTPKKFQKHDTEVTEILQKYKG